jgi:phosphate transport system substrate-binding protein
VIPVYLKEHMMTFKFLPLAFISFFSLFTSQEGLSTDKETPPKELTGAGATFPYPLYAKWAETYQKETNTQLNYQSIGSGGGIKQIKAGTVNFGASDKPLDEKDLSESKLMQFPAIIGGIVPIFNIKGIDQLTLDGQTLGAIFAGKITKWNDAALAALNPGVRLPDEPIVVAHRCDGSGTTFLFSHYLFDVSNDWKTIQGWDVKNPDKVKPDSTAQWPNGSVAGKGNQGVAGLVSNTPNSIGYVEYAYATENKLSHVVLKNKDGEVVEPSADAFSAAAENVDWSRNPSFYVIMTNQPGKKSWPITGASFILLRTEDTYADKNKEVCQFFDWAFKNGQEMATTLHYIPLPASLVTLIEKAWQDHKIAPKA